MCIRDRSAGELQSASIRNSPCRKCEIVSGVRSVNCVGPGMDPNLSPRAPGAVSYTHLRAHETSAHL
eukprot:2112742-Alexandrium_andersonii.AAC.1